MNVLIACEFSGIVRDAFTKKGHNAISCDLLPSESSGCHYTGDALELAHLIPFDLMVAHPPCTHLAVSGARWFKEKRVEQAAAVLFFIALAAVPIPKIAIENPVCIMSTRLGKPDQIIEPWQFGHGEKKRTCLWLKNLPLLEPTKIVAGRYPRVHRHVGPGPNRMKDRSRTYTGIAEAMADQWG